jgi:crotonobetainyl-CoA:carnitine CoA-transferase CaiB-like acyl-CoA transferase
MAESTSPIGPLSGYRVLDLSTVIMGPLSTQILGDLGAEVITVEPFKPDGNRNMGDHAYPSLSGISLNILRNKRNVCADLKDPRGRELFLRIAATCDVVVTNLRPGPLARLGVTYEDVVAVRPDIIYCEAHGFPSDGPRANAAAYDDIIQSASGIADLSRRINGVPAVTPTLIADKLCGISIVYGVTAALLHRERTGVGQHIEVPMLDVMRAFVLVEHGASAIPRPPLGPAGYDRMMTKRRRPQRTSDGWIHMLPYSARHFEEVFRKAGRDDLLGDPRFADAQSRIRNTEFLYETVEEIVLGATTAEWLAFCGKFDIPVTEIVNLDDIIDELPDADHPLAGAYKTIPSPVRFSASPATVRRPAPVPGQHNHEVLREVGFTDDEIAALTGDGVIRALDTTQK